jgi:hypothetical protein
MYTGVFIRSSSFYFNIRLLPAMDEYATADDAADGTAEV